MASLQEDASAPPAVPIPAATLPSVAQLPAPAVDPHTQQQTDARLDAAIVDDCFSKLNAIVSSYEALRSPTEEQTTSAAGTFARTLNGQCGMKDRVEADPRYQPIMRRLAPLNARMTVLIKKKCQALKEQEDAALREFSRRNSTRDQPGSCFQVCLGNGNSEFDCHQQCISRGLDTSGIEAEMRSLGCK